MVKVKKYFTYSHLNRSIAQFRFLGTDARNKPCEVNINGEKLGGHAVQNWCLVRPLPLLVGDRISDPASDTVQQLCLQLREISELVCAPKIVADQIAYLKVQIEAYLQTRRAIFPEFTLKPKHHYLAHYPQLILQFGPLIRLWMLRFESKHTYFKQCARKLHNFKNLCSTLAVRHQLLQAYFGAGHLFPSGVQAESEIEFYVSTYSADIQEVTQKLGFSPGDTTVANNIVFKGTDYKRDMFVPLEKK